MADLNLSPSQKSRVDHTCKTVVGMRLDVRKDKNTKVTGIVESAKPAYWGGRSLVFEVVLLCGVNKKPETVFISTFNSIR